MSAQVNQPRMNGRSLSGVEDRLNGILNRTCQKQAIKYLQNFVDDKYGKNAYIVEVIPPRDGTGGNLILSY